MNDRPKMPRELRNAIIASQPMTDEQFEKWCRLYPEQAQHIEAIKKAQRSPTHRS